MWWLWAARLMLATFRGFFALLYVFFGSILLATTKHYYLRNLFVFSAPCSFCVSFLDWL